MFSFRVGQVAPCGLGVIRPPGAGRAAPPPAGTQWRTGRHEEFVGEEARSVGDIVWAGRLRPRSPERSVRRQDSRQDKTARGELAPRGAPRPLATRTDDGYAGAVRIRPPERPSAINDKRSKNASRIQRSSCDAAAPRSCDGTALLVGDTARQWPAPPASWTTRCPKPRAAGAARSAYLSKRRDARGYQLIKKAHSAATIWDCYCLAHSSSSKCFGA